ncbi:TetR/AcrR family transcriptional regulator [Gulosibacter chungangensis]|uniref:TetR/AcrR family transcriptional regulator n=1 Tax=Gulosibacter chungangensis TaxID=979746 RepID=A0A7J5BFN3_9MICO|nr:TetR/AcrR family transcriptional regulator [Gulosibacter chungangensis]KAB1645055.1 TetR/AcrR family transcriptional regulator [Gulosibacter chungangensis]
MSDKDRKPGYGDGKEALLRATVEVVAKKGLRGMTFRAVAEAAGVNNTLIAHHFGNRDKLLAAALEWSTTGSIAAADLSEYVHDSHAFRQALLKNVATQPELEIFQYEMILEATRREEIRPAVHELYRRYLAALLPGLSPNGIAPNKALGRALFAALDGLMLQYFSRAITAEELSESLEALEAALAS